MTGARVPHANTVAALLSFTVLFARVAATNNRWAEVARPTIAAAAAAAAAAATVNSYAKTTFGRAGNVRHVVVARTLGDVPISSGHIYGRGGSRVLIPPI